MRGTKLKDLIYMNTILYEKTLLITMVDKEIDQIEAQELKQIYNQYLDERKDIMKSTEMLNHETFGVFFIKTYFSSTKKPNK